MNILFSEKLWKEAIKQFYYIPHLPGDTLLIKKYIFVQDFVLIIYYYYIIETNNGIKCFITKHNLNKPGLKFNYQLSMKPILEVN